MDLAISGRRAAVAAASRGLGFATARALAAEGVEVAICGRDAKTLGDAAHQIGARPIVADVATSGQHIKVYLDLIMQGDGAADTVMLVTSVLDPPSAVFESKLASAVAGRLPR